MFDHFKRNPKAAGLAIAMHLVLIFLLIFGLDWLVPPKDQRSAITSIKAQVVDATAIAAEAKRLEEEQKKVQAQEEAKKQQAEKAIKELQKKKEQEQKKLQDIEQQRKAAEQKRKLEAEKKRKQQEADQKRKAEAEAKQKAEAEKKQKAEEAKRKAEAEKKRKAEEDRKRREAELQKALEAEQASQQNAQAINAFALAVTERVTSNWIRPPATDLGLKVKLRVRVSDTGSVLAVQVVESSGNSAFDRSAEAAVYKSDPLPKPPPGVRELNFIFDPDRV
jgi:colicin import membrane protein